MAARMTLARFLPWQQDTACAWLANRERFAHAWLIHGLAGIGKTQFAQAAAASLLCEAPQDGLACGACPACTWVASGNHPDLRRIRPDALAVQEDDDSHQASNASAETSAQTHTESSAGSSTGTTKRAPSREIRIEQIRALQDWFNTTTHRNGWRVALLYPAQSLNLVAANALLKVLEEPPAHTLFLLVADAPDRLLPTLVSRCRRLPLAAPDAALARHWLTEQGVAQPADWLAAAGGAPLAALALAHSRAQACPDWLQRFAALLAPARLSASARAEAAPAPDLADLVEALAKTPAPEWLDNLQRLFVDVMLLATGSPGRYFPAIAAPLAVIAQRARATALADTAQWLARQRAVAQHPLAAKLFIQSVLQRAASALQG